MTKDIKVLGEPLKIAFNMAVQLAYEDITGEAFDITKLQTRKANISLQMAAIIVNNKDTAITMERLLNEASFDDFKALDAALAETMADWYKMPPVTKIEASEGKSRPIKRSRAV